MTGYERMLSYAPLYYRSSALYNALLASQGSELDLLGENTGEVRDQFFVETATWGLRYWEQEYGLTPRPDLTYGERRSRVKGKLRGVGKVGVELVKAVAEAYSNGEVEVAFDGDIIITFVSIRGIPTAMEVLKQQLAEIVPAHLTVYYVYTYLTWNEFDLLSAELQESMTWDSLEAYKPPVNP